MTDPVVDLTPAVVNIRLYRADGWSIPFTFKPGGVTTDITGWNIKAQCRTVPDDESATNLTVAITDGPNGKFTVSQPAAGVTGYYDIQMTPPAGVPRTYIRGRLTVDADVTRP